MTEVIISKICTKCKIEKPLSDFHKKASQQKDGHNAQCKLCRNKDFTKYRTTNPDLMKGYAEKSRLKNRESVLAGKKRYYERVKLDPEWQAKEKEKRIKNREKKAEYDKAYRADNVEKCKFNSDRWKSNNIEKVRGIKRKWKAQNIELVRQMGKDYQAKRRLWLDAGCDSLLEIVDWENSTEKVCHWCYCECEDNYHIDHYFPLSKGGDHTVDNLVIACAPCNLRKSAKLPEDFRAELDRELEELNQ